MTTQLIYSQDVVFRFTNFILIISTTSKIWIMPHEQRLLVGLSTLAKQDPNNLNCGLTRVLRCAVKPPHNDWPRAWVSGTFYRRANPGT